MSKTDQVSSRSNIHTPYKLVDGTRVPSVTTVLGELAKPALIHWAWDLGIKQIDYRTYRDELANIGSLAHAMILAHLKSEKPDTSAYSAAQIDLAENCFLSYLEWERQHKLEPIMIEQPLISEAFKYGGTPDYYGKIDNILSLMDFKTGKAIYPEYFYQLAAYSQLLPNMPDQFRVLNIGRSEDEKFIEQVKSDLTIEWQIFQRALEIYQLKRRINK